MHQYSGWSFRNQAPKLSELPGDISYDLCTATTLPYGQR